VRTVATVTTDTREGTFVSSDQENHKKKADREKDGLLHPTFPRQFGTLRRQGT
jgi:hypothetical protein